MRWRDLAERFAAERVSALAPKTQERYVNDLAHVCVRFGDHFVDAIEVAEIEDWLVESAREYAPTTVNAWLRTMRAAFQWGRRHRLVAANPAREAKALREGRTRGRRGVSLSASELRDLLGAVDGLVRDGLVSEDLGRMIEVLAWTGCRISELCALRFEDWDGDQLRIRRALSKRTVKAPKNADPRVVTVVEPLAAALDAQRR